MESFSGKNILSRPRMEDLITSIPVTDIAGVRGSPGKRIILPKLDPPALALTETVSSVAASSTVVIDEPLLISNPQRFVLFPVEHPDVMAMAKKAISVFWTAEEIDLTKDMRDWDKLDKNTQIWL